VNVDIPSWHISWWLNHLNNGNLIQLIFFISFSSRVRWTQVENLCRQHVYRNFLHNGFVCLAMDRLLCRWLEIVRNHHIGSAVSRHLHAFRCSRISKVSIKNSNEWQTYLDKIWMRLWIAQKKQIQLQCVHYNFLNFVHLVLTHKDFECYIESIHLYDINSFYQFIINFNVY